ncbi:MAG: hypothetical protein CMO40_06685 [Verrucomicrobiaceae bacterium]|nr:hypothetical protein [Verrucomicrobiaceae bacterium]
MPKLSPNPPSWLRTILIAVAIGLGAVLILFPAWLPDETNAPLEDRAVEIMQSALLAFAAALFFATAPHAGPFRAVYRSLGFLGVALLVAEIEGAINDVIDPLRHEYIVVPLLIWAGLTLSRRRRETLHFIGFASRHPASGFALAAIILVYAFAPAFGSKAFWKTSLGASYDPEIPSICRAYLELLACYFLLLAAIGFCLPLVRRRYQMFTEP